VLAAELYYAQAQVLELQAQLRAAATAFSSLQDAHNSQRPLTRTLWHNLQTALEPSAPPPQPLPRDPRDQAAGSSCSSSEQKVPRGSPPLYSREDQFRVHKLDLRGSANEDKYYLRGSANEDKYSRRRAMRQFVDAALQQSADRTLASAVREVLLLLDAVAPEIVAHWTGRMIQDEAVGAIIPQRLAKIKAGSLTAATCWVADWDSQTSRLQCFLLGLLSSENERRNRVCGHGALPHVHGHVEEAHFRPLPPCSQISDPNGRKFVLRYSLFCKVLYCINPHVNEPIHQSYAEAAYTIGSTSRFLDIMSRLGDSVGTTCRSALQELAAKQAPLLRSDKLIEKARTKLFAATLDNLDWSTSMNSVHIITRFVWMLDVPPNFAALAAQHGMLLHCMDELTVEDLTELTPRERAAFDNFERRLRLTNANDVRSARAEAMADAKSEAFKAQQQTTEWRLKASLRPPRREVELIKDAGGMVVGLSHRANGPLLRPHRLAGQRISALEDGEVQESGGRCVAFPKGTLFEVVDLFGDDGSMVIAKRMPGGLPGIMAANILVQGAPEPKAHDMPLKPSMRPTVNARMWDVVRRVQQVSVLEPSSGTWTENPEQDRNQAWHFMVAPAPSAEVAHATAASFPSGSFPSGEPGKRGNDSAGKGLRRQRREPDDHAALASATAGTISSGAVAAATSPPNAASADNAAAGTTDAAAAAAAGAAVPASVDVDVDEEEEEEEAESEDEDYEYSSSDDESTADEGDTDGAKSVHVQRPADYTPRRRRSPYLAVNPLDDEPMHGPVRRSRARDKALPFNTALGERQVVLAPVLGSAGNDADACKALDQTVAELQEAREAAQNALGVCNLLIPPLLIAS